MKYINTEEFREKIFDFKSDSTFKAKDDFPIILYYSAAWCGPCKMLAPIMDQISTEYEGKINIYKIDVDEEYELASLFNVRSIPTMYFVKGTVKEKIIGAIPKNQIIGLIENLLK